MTGSSPFSQLDWCEDNFSSLVPSTLTPEKSMYRDFKSAAQQADFVAKKSLYADFAVEDKHDQKWYMITIV